MGRVLPFPGDREGQDTQRDLAGSFRYPAWSEDSAAALCEGDRLGGKVLATQQEDPWTVSQSTALLPYERCAVLDSK